MFYNLAPYEKNTTLIRGQIMYVLEKIWHVEVNDANGNEGYVIVIPGDSAEAAEKSALQILFASDVADIKVGEVKTKRYFNLPCMMCQSDELNDYK